MVRWPALANAAFVRLKGLLPKNPRCADSGDGCADSMMVCREVSIKALFLRAALPHNTNTTCSRLLFTVRMISSVNVSQPLPWWLAGSAARTVSVEFTNNTP